MADGAHGDATGNATGDAPPPGDDGLLGGTLLRSLGWSGEHPRAWIATERAATQHALPGQYRHERPCRRAARHVHPPRSKHAHPSMAPPPSRKWGAAERTQLGGETMVSDADGWAEGTLWDRNSNVCRWNRHEVRRNAARAAYDVHRAEQVVGVVLPGTDRVSSSGMVSCEDSFLEMYGFELGRRARSCREAPKWNAVNSNRAMRTAADFGRADEFPTDRAMSRTADYGKSLVARKHTSLRSVDTLRAAVMRRVRNQTTTEMYETHKMVDEASGATLRGDTTASVCGGEEEAGGESKQSPAATSSSGAGMTATGGLPEHGQLFGSVSAPGWEAYGHVTTREGAKLSCGVHGNKNRRSTQHLHDKAALRPAAMYTKKFQKMGADGFRTHASPAALWATQGLYMGGGCPDGEEGDA